MEVRACEMWKCVNCGVGGVWNVEVGACKNVEVGRVNCGGGGV